MDTKDMYHPARRGVRPDVGIDLNNPYTEPEAPRTGRRRPHVPSSKTYNVKDHTDSKSGQQRRPDFEPGD